ncbi:hypothetical protein E6H16_04220 [Candidatus Bathyarchaeota archaeon]|nr:MAG: hypothetical protein E6H16_04220 [Candidatus Bathyarchaeota archaeon]
MISTSIPDHLSSISPLTPYTNPQQGDQFMFEMEVLDRLRGDRPKFWCWKCRRFTEHLVTRSYVERRIGVQDTVTCLICRGKSRQ